VDNPATRKHLPSYSKAGRWTCSCGWQDSGDATNHWAEVRLHLRAARRWIYLGVEWHYGEAYYMWEHRLTGIKYAWLQPMYALQHTTKK
jgi:hypothetical protein